MALNLFVFPDSNDPDPLVLYHGRSCPDGFAAALAAWQYFGGRGEYLSLDHGDIRTVDDLPALTGRAVYILDFSFEADILRAIEARAAKLVMLDHHLSAAEKLTGFACRCGVVHFDMGKSGSRLAWEFFHPDQPLPDLVRHIEDRDIWTWQYPDSAAFLAALDMEPFDFERWQELANFDADQLADFKARGVAMDQKFTRLAEQIAASTTFLGELLDSLLDISRLDVAGIKPDSRPAPVQPIFERLANSFRRAATDRNITLRFRPSRLWVESDPIMLERMIANLVSNALRYTQPGGCVLVAARSRGNRVSIEVRDNGIGIAKENQQAIFTEFYQVANPARGQHQGLGLGLSIVDRLSKVLGIKVGLRSALNQGTIFSLTVQGSAALPTPAMPENTGPELNPLYLIGNSPAISAAGKLAEGWGYQVTLLAEGATPPAGRLSGNPLIMTEEGLAQKVHDEWPGNLTLIALTSAPGDSREISELPEGTRLCPLPLRPAKLRALLGQIQNTSSKSMP